MFHRLPLRAAAAAASLLVLVACGDVSGSAKSEGIGPEPSLPPPQPLADPDRQHRARERLAGRRRAAAGARRGGARLRQRARPSALALRAAERRRAGRRDQRAAERPTTSAGMRGWVMKQVMKRAGAGVPSANRITLLRDADGDGVAEMRIGVPRGPELAVRHGAGRQRLLRRQHRRAAALSLRAGRDADRRARHAASSTCPAGRSTITGPRT